MRRDRNSTDLERLKLWDIQDQKNEAHGKKIVDVMFHGQTNEGSIPASIKVDVSLRQKRCVNGKAGEGGI